MFVYTTAFSFGAAFGESQGIAWKITQQLLKSDRMFNFQADLQVVVLETFQNFPSQ